MLRMMLLRACLLIAASYVVSVDGTESFEIVLGIPHAGSEKLEKAFWDISTPGTSNYLKHLSLEKIKDIIGVKDEVVEKAKEFLTLLGAKRGNIRVNALADVVVATFRNTDVRNDTWTTRGLPRKELYNQHYDFVFRRDSLSKETKVLPSVGKELVSRLSGAYSIGNQKKAYGIPTDLVATNESLSQMVWGPGTFGYSPDQLQQLKESQCPLLNLSKVKFDTDNHGTPGGDNWGEGNLDVAMITSFGLNVETIVSNTNTSSSTEEGKGFGLALLDFITELASREKVPQVLSISLGSLSAFSCDLLCEKAVNKGFDLSKCQAFLQDQRQVCMFMSKDQVNRINAAFKVLGARGTSVFGSSGDGGSHFSFGPFSGGGELGNALNEISCQYQMPVFPTTSPYVTSVGGTDWGNFFPSPSNEPQAWYGSGGGFSWQFERPTHQNWAVNQYLKKMNSSTGFPPQNSYNAVGRGYPDISAVSVDGTSQSSPTMAGIWSLIMDHRLNKGLPPLGYLGPRLYQTMEKYSDECFHDIVKGNSKTTCDSGFGCTKGWDPVTGFGRPIWEGMLKHFGTDD